jgi:hypothetical protein
MSTGPSRTINFIIGNHAPCVVTEDAFEYILQGVKGIGAPIRYSIDEYLGDAINIIMEGALVTTATSFAGLRQTYPRSRLYMIPTEILTDGRFNSANTVQQADGDHYSNSTYWAQRSAGFFAVLPQIDGLIFTAESLVDGYRDLQVRSYYLPLVALPGYAVVQRESEALRDIDVYFSGTLTAYRVKVLNALAQEGFNVVSHSTQYPNYVRRRFLARSKLAVGLRLGENTQFTSKQRAHYYLVNRIPHLFEATPDHTDLHRFIQFAEPGDVFLERCFELLNGMQAFPEPVFDDFRRNEAFDPASVFRDFVRFLYET